MSSRQYSALRASAVIVLAATLDLEAVSRHLLTELPPSVWPHVAILGDLDWRDVCRGAIRAQETMLAEARHTKPTLLRADPCQLNAFLSL